MLLAPAIHDGDVHCMSESKCCLKVDPLGRLQADMFIIQVYPGAGKGSIPTFAPP
jgi:hypothetical protein